MYLKCHNALVGAEVAHCRVRHGEVVLRQLRHLAHVTFCPNNLKKLNFLIIYTYNIIVTDHCLYMEGI